MAAPKQKRTRWSKAGKSTIPWPKDPNIMARIEAVNRMRMEGIWISDIAQRLECSEQTVRRDIRRMQDILIEERKADMRLIQDEAIDRYREVQRRAMELYNQHSDARTKLGALKEYREAQARIDQLTGAAAPIKVDHTTGGKALDVKMMTESQLEAIAAGRLPDDSSD